MANIYKNAFANLVSANTTFYTTPSDSRAIIQNIQIANDNQNNNNVEIYIHDHSANVSYELFHKSFPNKTTSQGALGPIVLEENDYIFGEAATNDSATVTVSILEINRNEV